ncbi:Gfo/Idh/MocA family protein [Subtercola frigoramans]|uniref:Dehydrogenase n=1 Tax=Subtercola frigoramans TaxID=120298 RepID=A0ABS2L1Q7_9MICO|nr:Gfo/Idh/MocA family oxidoreductase [Subtercola frigoramans]MBM7471002.1 putative dehydrogenase [Subtercola frigoramans]
MTDRIGVGIVGAGPVVQAIHLPTLARLTNRFEVRVILDIDENVATDVADRVSARATTDFQDLLDDPSVEVVAICTPAFLHAEQVIAALESNKRAVFCEKPLARTLAEAARIADAVERTGVPLVVGAMHTFDPGWLAVGDVVEKLAATAHTVRSSIALPFNNRFEDWATEIVQRPPRPEGGTPDAEALASLMSLGVLELAIHDLPVVRRFLPDADEVTVSAAVGLEPFGYAITAVAGDRMIELFGLISAQWQPKWEFEAISDDTMLHIEFTPSFVQAGSAVATVTMGGVSTTYGSYGHNGYEGEWRAIGDIVEGNLGLMPDIADLIDDLTFAIRLAEGAADVVRSAALSAEASA